MKTGLALLLVLSFVAGGVLYVAPQLTAEHPPSYRTATVQRGDLHPTISATGTLEPEEVVDVGAQVAGKIRALGHDPADAGQAIDYGSIVHVGTDLAYIDDAVFQAQVDQAEASQQRAQADLLQAQLALELAEQEWKRAESLRPRNVVTEAEYDQAVANHKLAKVKVAVMEAGVKQSDAALRLAKTNLDYTVIKSPVEGVIIDRRVNVGQTVVASLNAPSLFLIAKDLRRMQVWASVNEADVGRIQPGLPVRFTVDAFPRQVFLGKVKQVRLNATMTQNVVTYTVVVLTDNSDGQLLPYLTANVQFEIDRCQNVLLVPNAALRWRPRTNPAATDNARTTAPSAPNLRDREPPAKTAKASGTSQAAKSGQEQGESGRLWVKKGDSIQVIEVQLGTTDGICTEVSGNGLREGREVVVGEERPKSGSEEGGITNPFTPKIGR